MSDEADWKCSEKGFNDFLAANPVFDRSADLQWALHREYWANAKIGHRNALNACMSYARLHGITSSLYTDPKTKRKIHESDPR